MAAIDEVLEKYVSGPTATLGGLNGVAFAVADKNGKILYKKAFGKLNFENDDKMTTSAVCWIASMTKFMTATSAALVIEKGLINVDTDVGTVCKELENMNIVTGYNEDGSPQYTPAKNKVTLKELCTHSSGMAYDLFDPEMQKWSESVKRTINTLNSTVESIQVPLLFEPGQGWRYSIGLDWAGQTVERLTKKDLNTFMKENIWDPLGMDSTTFELTPELRSRTMKVGARELPTQPLTAGQLIHPDPAPIAMGGGGSYSTCDDYIKFLSHILGVKTGVIPDGKGIMTKATAELLFKPQLEGMALGSLQYIFDMPEAHDGLAPAYPVGTTQANYALGGAVNINDIPEKRKAGSLMWSGMANTHWWIDPTTGICGTLFTQILPPGDSSVVSLLNEVEKAVYKTLA